MKSYKEIFENIKIDTGLVEDSLKSFMKKEFKGDKEYINLKKAANKNTDNVPDFLDYIYSTLGDVVMDDLSKKYKMDANKIAAEMLK